MSVAFTVRRTDRSVDKFSETKFSWRNGKERFAVATSGRTISVNGYTCGAWQLGKPGRVYPRLREFRARSWQCLAFPVSLLQKRRRSFPGEFISLSIQLIFTFSSTQIPYLLMVIAFGFPVFFAELVIGQFSGLGAIKAFAFMAPFFKGDVMQLENYD